MTIKPTLCAENPTPKPRKAPKPRPPYTPTGAYADAHALYDFPALEAQERAEQEAQERAQAPCTPAHPHPAAVCKNVANFC